MSFLDSTRKSPDVVAPCFACAINSGAGSIGIRIPASSHPEILTWVIWLRTSSRISVVVARRVFSPTSTCPAINALASIIKN
ncbi:MAG: hypothetical protein RBG13Loki_4179 [Promethearchaeota archaeon CR_4]|nr:MAG: hypothetical protein RBG13Loki_4179 [Candidatus Lokiarchaeota archaeon CR_4]